MLEKIGDKIFLTDYIVSNIRTPVKKKLHQRVLLFDENDPHTRGISNVWYPSGIIQQMT